MLLSKHIEEQMIAALAKHLGPEQLFLDILRLVAELLEQVRVTVKNYDNPTAQSFKNELIRTDNCWRMAVTDINQRLRQDCRIPLTLWHDLAFPALAWHEMGLELAKVIAAKEAEHKKAEQEAARQKTAHSPLTRGKQYDNMQSKGRRRV